ncbi:uncharacterized protein LOC114532861 [Dendronephthya gigantea]|uniref:uncharacterized protein LOC114532861 n=1 Tax=Dendronephthya gigantea TaxID=151771 RepID=UPI00106B115E|nr:uncharacterized protein LOC114532861 [Dendronephthya gigantea]
MLLPKNENSSDNLEKQDETELKASHAFVAPSVTTNTGSNPKLSSKCVAITALSILNKLPKSSAVSQFSTVETSYAIQNSARNNVNLPDLSAKRSTKITAFYGKYFTKQLTPGGVTNKMINATSYNTQKWPLASDHYPGFKPLGFRIRPTFGEQCLKTGIQWPDCREDPGPSLPFMDLFDDHPTHVKSCEPMKNNSMMKPVKSISRSRRNRFPALFDPYNIRRGLLTFEGKSRPCDIISEEIQSSVEFPKVRSCQLNEVIKHERDNLNERLENVESEDCSDCQLCLKEIEHQARVSDANKLPSSSNSQRYHIRLPTID